MKSILAQTITLFLAGTSLVWAGSLAFNPQCTQPNPPVDSCVGGPFSAFSEYNLDLTTTQTPGVVTNSIQGTMTIRPGPNGFLPDIGIFIRQTIIPEPGFLYDSNQADIYVWTEQPLTGTLYLEGIICAQFSDCNGLNEAPVPLLGPNPNLADAGHLHMGDGGMAFCGTNCALVQPTWSNYIKLWYFGSGDPGVTELHFVVDATSTLTGVNLVPEPNPAAELGIGIAAMMAVLYRRKA